MSCAEYSPYIISFIIPNQQIGLFARFYRCVVCGLGRMNGLPKGRHFIGNKRQSWDSNAGLSAKAHTLQLHAVMPLTPGHDFIMWRVGSVVHGHKIVGKRS